MEIYSFKDTIEDGKKVLRITDLRQGVKNPNRVNVFINDKYSFSLDLAQVVDLGIKKGKSITEAELAEYKKASEFGKEYQRALEWALMRPRSERELRDYLRRREVQRDARERKKEWDKDREMAEAIAQGEDPEKLERRRERRLAREAVREKYDFKDLILQRLAERGYVDDRKFAEYYVENRFVKKGVSRRRLAMELIKKGVASDVVEEVLDGRNEEEELRKMIAKKRKKYDDEKLIAYLCRQGFGYDMVSRLVRESND